MMSVFWWHAKHNFEQCPVYLFWVPGFYSCTLCGHPIYEVTSMVASLGEIDEWQQAKEIRSVKTQRGTDLVKTPSR